MEPRTYRHRQSPGDHRGRLLSAEAHSSTAKSIAARPKNRGGSPIDLRAPFGYFAAMAKYLVAVLAILLTGCGGLLPGSLSSKRENVSFASTADIRDALNKTGL